MNTFSNFKITRQALAAFALCAVAAHAAAGNVYHVEINTTQLTGSGWLDLQFNPGNDTAPAAVASLSHFVGQLGSDAPQIAGDVNGSLGNVGSQVSFANTTTYNDLFQSVRFGQRLSFDVSFSGSFLNSNNTSVGSSFGVALYGSDQVTVLGNGDANSGSLLTFQLLSTGSPVGNISSVVYDPTLINVSAVPEASEWMMMVAGLGVLGALARRRKVTQA